MTSANVTHYRLYDSDDTKVFKSSQHCLCKDHIKKDLKDWYDANGDATLILTWPDEHEAPHYSIPMKLSEYLEGKKVKWED